MKELTLENVIAIVNGQLPRTVTAAEIDCDLKDFGMDSIGFIRVIVALEDAFDCEIPDSKLLFSEMNTVSKMWAVLTALSEGTL